VKQAGQIQKQADLASSANTVSSQEETGTERARRFSLSLNGQAIHDGDLLSLRIFGSWVVGEAHVDHTGWYLWTTNHVGIRLSDGLTARWEQAR
jgi:hypothetical protein